MKDKVVFQSREWLNKKMGLAAVQATYERCDVGKEAIGYGALKFTDCNRQVSLDFSACTLKECENALAKIEKIQNACFGIAEALDDLHADLLSRKSKKEKK